MVSYVTKRGAKIQIGVTRKTVDSFKNVLQQKFAAGDVLVDVV